MGTLAKDERVIDAVADTGISASLSNSLEDQLRAMVKGLHVVAPIAGANFDSSGSLMWYFLAANDPPYWNRSGSHANPLMLPVGTLRENQKIEAAYVWIYGDATGGSIQLYRNTLNTTPSTQVSIGSAGTDPWNQGGAWAQLTLSITAEDAVKDASYHFLFTPPSSGTARVLGAALQVAFGSYV